MTLAPADLLTGEQLLANKWANAVIRVQRPGLAFFLIRQGHRVAGLHGDEAVGGHLYLTTYRLVFQSHPFNWVTGTFSIFLPTIQAMHDTSHVITKQLGVQTRTHGYTFVVWGIPELRAAILAARDRLSLQEQVALREVAVAEVAKCGAGVGVQRALEAIKEGSLTVTKLHKLLDVASQPFEVATVLGLLELYADRALNTEAQD